MRPRALGKNFGSDDFGVPVRMRIVHLRLRALLRGDQARRAREAYRDFGKGSGHPAGLNFGDCFAYALATSLGEPLLFKGDDFARTDIVPAR